MKTTRPVLMAMIAGLAAIPSGAVEPPTPNPDGNRNRRNPPLKIDVFASLQTAMRATKHPHEPTPAELRAQAKRNQRSLRNLRNEKKDSR